MKFWKHKLITTIAFLGLSTAVFYTSCEKDSCEDLKCLNNGACTEGFCRCPTGYEGTLCEQETATKFLGRFTGHFACPGNPPINDTVVIWLMQSPDRVHFVDYTDITDTLTGTVSGIELTFDTKIDGNYKKYTRAQLNANKLSVFTEKTVDPQTGQTQGCSFTGFN